MEKTKLQKRREFLRDVAGALARYGGLDKEDLEDREFSEFLKAYMSLSGASLAREVNAGRLSLSEFEDAIAKHETFFAILNGA